MATYRVRSIIFTGVAGATAPQLNIGDVVIATYLYQHDMDARPLFPRYEVPLLSTQFFGVDKNLLALAYESANSFFQDRLAQIITEYTLQSFSITSPQVHQGVIASGDQFVDKLAKTHSLIREVPETIAVEMEGAAVAQVCFEHNLPFIVIRTISDRADHTAAIEFSKFVSEVAMHYSMGIVEEMYKRLLNKQEIAFENVEGKMGDGSTL